MQPYSLEQELMENWVACAPGGDPLYKNNLNAIVNRAEFIAEKLLTQCMAMDSYDWRITSRLIRQLSHLAGAASFTNSERISIS